MTLTFDHPISCIKFSPTESHLLIAVSSPICSIFVYSFPALTKLCTLSGLTSSIHYIDFSLDSTIVRAVTQNYEIAHFDLKSGKPLQDVFSDIKNETWNTYTAPVGWGSSGVYSIASNGKDVCCADRSLDELRGK